MPFGPPHRPNAPTEDRLTFKTSPPINRRPYPPVPAHHPLRHHNAPPAPATSACSTAQQSIATYRRRFDPHREELTTASPPV